MGELEQYDQFAEMLERNCRNLWRTVVGREDQDLILQVNSILFTKKIDEERNGSWAFSFALRRGERWGQEQVEVEPFVYDPLNAPREFDEERSLSPENRASALALEMVEGAVGKIRW